MRETEYRILFEAEEKHWWYVGLHRLVLSVVEQCSGGRKLDLLDAGCGTGKIMTLLEEHRRTGIDVSEEALKFCRERGLENISKANICELPFDDEIFDVVISLDVLYHMKVDDDEGALKEFYRVLRPGGTVILNLPAYDFLRGRHDAAIQTKRRYNAGQVSKMLKNTGFMIDKLSYRNTVLFPLALIKRVIERIFPESRYEKIQSDLSKLPRAVNNVFTWILLMENRLLKSISFPFGLSVFCVAKK